MIDCTVFDCRTLRYVHIQLKLELKLKNNNRNIPDSKSLTLSSIVQNIITREVKLSSEARKLPQSALTDISFVAC